MAVEAAGDPGAAFTIFDCVLRGSPLPGSGEAPSLSAAAKAVAALHTSSADVAAGLWAAYASKAFASSAQVKELHGCVGVLVAGEGDAVVLRREDVLEIFGDEAYKEILGEGAVVGKGENKIRTAMFYTQQSFNLFREASEGYAKLICLLGDGVAMKASEGDPAFVRAVVDQVHALMGNFHLELCKVCEIVLAACCARLRGEPRLALAPLYSALLDVFERKLVAAMLGHLLSLHYPERTPVIGASEISSRAVLQLIATLLRLERLELVDVWCDLCSTNAALRKMDAAYREKLQEVMSNRTGLIPQANAGRGGLTPAAGGPRVVAGPSDRNLFKAFPVVENGPYAGLKEGEVQKLELVEVLVMQGRCFDVLEAVQLLSGDELGAVDVAAHPPIGVALCALLHAVIGPAVLEARVVKGRDEEGDRARLATARDIDASGGVARGFLESIPDRSVLLDESDPRTRAFVVMLELLGPHARRLPALMQELCLLLQDPAAKDNVVAEAIVEKSLLPALSLTQSDGVLAANIWAVVESWHHEKRWRLYKYLEEDVPALYPVAKLVGERSAYEFKQSMKRMTVENAEGMSTVVSKLSHSQPLFVINALMQHLCGYPVDDSLVSAMVSMCTRNSDLTHDVTLYIILHRMSDRNRSKIKDDGVNATQWFANMSGFIAVFIRRITPLVDDVRPQINGVLYFLMNQIGVNRDVMASVMLSDILADVAGVSTINILSERQVLAQAGGPALIEATSGLFATIGTETSVSGKLLNSRRSKDIATAIITLREAFVSTGIAADLGIAIGKLSKHMLNIKKFEDQQLKAVSKLMDRMHHLLLQYSGFLSIPITASGDSGSSLTLGHDLLAIGLAPLVMEYGLQLGTSFILLRPIIDYLSLFPSATEKLSGDVTMSSGAVEDGGLTSNKLPVSEMVAAFDAARDVDDKKHLSTELLVTFWTLGEGDLHVPLDGYKSEISRLKGAVVAWESAIRADHQPRHSVEKSPQRKTLEAEVQKMKECLKALEDEMASRSLRQKTVAGRLALRKTAFAAANASTRDAAFVRNRVLLFLQCCMLPRCSITGTDAAFCARFPLKLMAMDVPVFDIANYYEMLLDALPGKILSSSEGEAEHVAALLRDTLMTLDSWRKRKADFDRDCSSPSGGRFVSANLQGDSPEPGPMDHKEYCDWLYKLHHRLAKAFEEALKSQSEYLMLRNTLGALSRIIDVFPTVHEHWSQLSECVGKLQKSSRLEDITTSALALSARLEKRKTKTMAGHQFRLRPKEMSGPPPAPRAAPHALPPGATPENGDVEMKPADAGPASRKRARSPKGDLRRPSPAKAQKLDGEETLAPRASPAVSVSIDAGPQTAVVGMVSTGHTPAGSPIGRGGNDDKPGSVRSGGNSHGEGAREGRARNNRGDRRSYGGKRKGGEGDEVRERQDRERYPSYNRGRDKGGERERESERDRNRERGDRERDRDRGRESERDRDRVRDRGEHRDNRHRGRGAGGHAGGTVIAQGRREDGRDRDRDNGKEETKDRRDRERGNEDIDRHRGGGDDMRNRSRDIAMDRRDRAHRGNPRIEPRMDDRDGGHGAERNDRGGAPSRGFEAGDGRDTGGAGAGVGGNLPRDGQFGFGRTPTARPGGYLGYTQKDNGPEQRGVGRGGGSNPVAESGGRSQGRPRDNAREDDLLSRRVQPVAPPPPPRPRDEHLSRPYEPRRGGGPPGPGPFGHMSSGRPDPRERRDSGGRDGGRDASRDGPRDMGRGGGRGMPPFVGRGGQRRNAPPRR